MDDVDSEHQRLVAEAGLSEVLPLRTEEFGQRHFITVVPPSQEYAALYTPV